MTVLSTPQQEAMEKRSARIAHFLELQFSDGTSRLTTFNQTINWGGYDWSGLGQILTLSQVSEGEGPSARPITFAITASKAEWLALAVGPVDEYRGRPAKLYMAPLDTGYKLIGTPVLVWRGIMDAVTIGINGNDGGVEIRCETAAYALKRRPALRMNASQHKQDYPTETGFDYLVDLLANPKVWLSKKFQKV
jgi:hypothetical protein